MPPGTSEGVAGVKVMALAVNELDEGFDVALIADAYFTLIDHGDFDVSYITGYFALTDVLRRPGRHGSPG